MITFVPGDHVVYKPEDEPGVVTKVNDKYVFVLFDFRGTAKACRKEDLELF